MFIQSAFIRKNSPYLQEKLKEMGYKTDSTSVNTGCIATSSTHDSFVVIDESRFDSINMLHGIMVIELIVVIMKNYSLQLLH